MVEFTGVEEIELVNVEAAGRRGGEGLGLVVVTAVLVVLGLEKLGLEVGDRGGVESHDCPWDEGRGVGGETGG